MKKLLSILIALVLIASLFAGCKKPEESKTPTQEQTQEQTQNPEPTPADVEGPDEAQAALGIKMFLWEHF